MSYAEPDFHGTSRFEIRRHLGTGGMGAVYQAYDRDRKEDVALKTVLRADPTAVYLFKREFRNLADVAHPNLVNLYELLYEEGHWFFTMELLDGVDFLGYIRSGTAHSGRRRPEERPDAATTAVDLTGPADLVQAVAAPAVSPTQLERLRFSIRQLAEGLATLHDKGYLHRDLKPSNVMVTRAERVVILDFGLSGELTPEDDNGVEPFIGTPTYMAPEQGHRTSGTTASDWYAVGVMIFEAVTGRPPFVGSYAEVLIRKSQTDAPRPSQLVAGVPDDLDQLCAALLRRDPSARPSAHEIFRLLRVRAHSLVTPVTPRTARTSTLVGREAELGELARAYKLSSTGRAVTVSVHGSSGIGKTALVAAFLQELQHDTPNLLVLSGRCYERESVPYKAIDGIIDRLTQHLMSLPTWQAAALLPPTVRALTVLFPGLLRASALATTADVVVDPVDPLGLRRTAFAALRELLARIGRRHALVITIDDLQWTDADSLALLDDLLRPPWAPSVLVILTFRSEEIPARPFLQQLLANQIDDHRAIEVHAITDIEARDLALRLLDPATSDAEHAAEAIAREAAGNPFLIEQLAACYPYGRAAGASSITVGEMLEIRLAGLPENAREVLDALAVAARPTDPDLAASAVGASAAMRSLTTALRSAQMIRSAGSSDKIEVYHDRIRDALVHRLSVEETRRIHGNLAAAIERSDADDFEALYEHHLGAGHDEAAGAAALAAARRGFTTLAFDRAALFYRRALELPGLSEDDQAEGRRQVGSALANAGRTLEAARAFLKAADTFDATTALELRRHAAEQLLLGGHLEGGIDVMRSVLEAVGLRLPGGPRRALARLLFRRAQLRLRGLKFTERAAGQIPEADVRRIDACWGASIGLGLVDLVTGAYFQSTQLALALDAGDPYRIARALAVEAASVSTAGGPARERAAEILHTAEGVARRVGNPHALGLCSLGAGLAAFLTGQWKKCTRLCDEASNIFRERCTGVTWEQTNAFSFAMGGLLYVGELAEIERRLAVWLPDARERGNLYAITEAQTRYNICWLVAGNPEAARAEVSQAIEAWSRRGFFLQHYNAMLAKAQIELYLNRAEDALELVNASWRELTTSLLMRVQVLRLEAFFLRARARLAAAAQSPQPHRLAVMAEADAKKIEAEHMTWSDPLAYLVRSGVAHVQGRVDDEMTWLRRAIDGFEFAGMGLYSHAATYALGSRIGGTEGAGMVSDAHLWMQTQKIKDPHAITRMIIPGVVQIHA
jgi:eukaryotic-like serine/threonine-protein kinase